jgi:hypothetical protein
MVLLSTSVFAQTDKEEKKEEREERRAKVQDRVDYSVFRRQILASKEYSEERHKVTSLQRNTKEVIKVVAYVDSVDNSEDGAKQLTGYIAVNVGESSTNVYEFKYDRATKKIAATKPTGETVEVEQDEKAAAKKTAGKSPVKKKSEEDEEEEDEEEKPSRKKDKDGE